MRAGARDAGLAGRAMTGSAALSVYLALSRLAGPMAPVLLSRRVRRGKEDPARLHERLGRPQLPRPEGPLIWLHGASVGEAVSTLPLIEALAARSTARFLVTTGTVTSARRLADALPERAVHQYVPVDTGGAVRGFLDHWRPDLAIWIESELWPRLVVEAAARGVPMALVNARISARSAARWSWVPRMAARVLGAFRMIRAQDDETVSRLTALGATGQVGGNLKALVPPLPADAAEVERYGAAFGGRPVWLAASTHAGEEEAVLAAQRLLAAEGPAPLLILAPRHPERGGEVAALLDGAGAGAHRRSGGVAPGPEVAVVLADTLGEMGLWYRLAAVTFVGGSLVARGGHTPFEPLALGSAVVHGPHVANFAPAYRALGAADAASEVGDAPGLAAAVRALLQDGPRRAEAVARGQAVQRALAPDLDMLATELLSFMEPAP